MDVLERRKINTAKSYVEEESIKQAKHYIKKRKPDIAEQYTTIAESVQKVTTLSEVMYFKVVLASLNAINDEIWG